MAFKPPLPGETIAAYHRRLGLEPSELPVVTHHKEIGEKTKVALSIGRTAMVVGAIFGAGWMASTEVGKMLSRQAALEEKLKEMAAEMLTFRDLVEVQGKVELSLRKRLASAEVYVRCDNFVTRGQTHKRCPIKGLMQSEDME